MSLLLTRMNDLRVKKANLDKYEYRASRYGAFSLFQKQTEEAGSIITKEMADQFWGSIGRDFNTKVIDYDKNVSIRVGQPRRLEIPDSENTSRFVTITPVALDFGFTMVPSMYLNNEVGYQEDFEKKMTKYINAMAVELDNMCITKLTTERTKVLGNTLRYNFNDGVLSATNAQKDHIIGSLESLMNSNDFYDTLDVLGDIGLQDMINQLRQHGANNDQNKQLEYAGKNLYFSNRVMTGSENLLKGFAVNSGSVGLMWRVDRESLARRTTDLSYKWDITTLPMLNIPIGTMEYQSVGNYSGIAGDATADMTASFKQHYGFAVDVAIVASYNSLGEAGATPILEFEVKA
jgi:hypothetical protein